MEYKRILAIGAHPDDIELGCGGSLIKYIHEGNKVYGLVLTKGEKGNHPSDLSECKKSAKKMGLEKIIVLNFRDANLVEGCELVTAIRSHIIKYRPNILYCHSPNDYHQDHKVASSASLNAARMGIVKSVFLFEGPSTKVEEFEPHKFTNITNYYVKKIKCLEQYQSQLNKKGSVLEMDWVNARALNWGLSVRQRSRKGKVFYGEAFEINHIIED